MSYAAHRSDIGSFAAEAPSKIEPTPKRPGILQRIFHAFMEARQRDADRQIAGFLAARSAERLTDDLEREMFQRLTTSNWSANASPYGERSFP